MALSAFADKAHSPEPDELAKTLGRTSKLWARIVSDIARDYDPIAENWSFAGEKYGWSMRLKRKDRVVLYLIPQVKSFLAAIVLGEKAVAATRQQDLPDHVRKLIDSARPYVEGRGIRLPVTSRNDLDVIHKLVSAKMSK